MSDWSVRIAKQAELDLHETYEYIALTLLEPGIARNLLRRIEEMIDKLDFSPQRYAVYPKEPWKSRGLRRVNAGNFAIFFIPYERTHTVVVIRIIYGGRDIDNILNDIAQNNKTDE